MHQNVAIIYSSLIKIGENLKVFGNIFTAHVVFGNILNLLWSKYAIGVVANGQN